jgi:quercetin dioxygenase-like cupin family protein
MAADDWTPVLRAELEERTASPLVGTRLLGQDRHARIWEIRLAPGARIPFHRHVLDYAWTCITGGSAVSRSGDGEVTTVRYDAGETRSLSFGPGESMIHDLENTGDAELIFTTVEYLDSPNDPLPLPADA